MVPFETCPPRGANFCNTIATRYEFRILVLVSVQTPPKASLVSITGGAAIADSLEGASAVLNLRTSPFARLLHDRRLAKRVKTKGAGVPDNLLLRAQWFPARPMEQPPGLIAFQLAC
jgi:hypothetical protein